MISSKITITILAASCFPAALVCATEYVIGKSGEFCSTSPLTLSECKDYADEIGKPIDVNSRLDIHPGCSLTSSSVTFNENAESMNALSSYRPVCSTEGKYSYENNQHVYEITEIYVLPINFFSAPFQIVQVQEAHTSSVLVTNFSSGTEILIRFYLRPPN